MYEIKLPDFSTISEERKSYLEHNADELSQKWNLEKYRDEEYYPREKIKYLEVPSDFSSIEEVYYTIKCLRKGNITPIKSTTGGYFKMNIPPFVQKLLSDLDRNGMELHEVHFTQNEKEYFLQDGILEEAISSSQIEGAQTTANVAKEIILRDKVPQNAHEMMVVNNYKAMVFITNTDQDTVLSEQFLLDLQTILTKNTINDEEKIGRFRTDKDNIVVMNPISGEIYYKPPTEEMMKEEMKKLIDFANDKDDSYFHPFIKATILHFWIGYLHPFCDGNGRTARALFYRYLHKKGYKDFTYIPISRTIKNSKKQYGDSYLYAEQEGNDLTFFLVYIAQKTKQAFKEYKEFILQQREEHHHLQIKISEKYHELLNERQLSLITYFFQNSEKYINNSYYQKQYNVSPNTAKSDLLGLKNLGLLQTKHGGNFINYYPTQDLLELK